MWDALSDPTKRVVWFAQEEAVYWGAPEIRPEHLLLGLSSAKGCIGAQLLERLGVSLSEIREEIESRIPAEGPVDHQEPTLGPCAQEVLDLARDEARQLGHDNYVGSDYLLLGILRQGDSLAAQVLAEAGADLASARREVAEREAETRQRTARRREEQAREFVLRAERKAQAARRYPWDEAEPDGPAGSES